jgi:hypothetical protein
MIGIEFKIFLKALHFNNISGCMWHIVHLWGKKKKKKKVVISVCI